MAIKIAGSPINWSNDDFPILGFGTSMNTILGEIQTAGYEGTELSNKLPKDPARLASTLRNFDLEIAAGWQSTYFLLRSLEEEKEKFASFLEFLSRVGASIAVVAESSYCPFKPLDGSPYDEHFQALTVPLFPFALPTLSDEQWTTLGRGFGEIVEMAKKAGIKVGYHPHMQTVVQNVEQLHVLLEVAPTLGLTVDVGHLAFAGAEPLDILDIIDKYQDRIVHYHMKNVRTEIIERARCEPMSFEWAVIEGCFTVAGDGGLDFSEIYRRVVDTGYDGWWVLEAEQNPKTSNPLLYATLAREFTRFELASLLSQS